MKTIMKLVRIGLNHDIRFPNFELLNASQNKKQAAEKKTPFLVQLEIFSALLIS